MQRVLIISNWDLNFENAESRKRSRLGWLPVPIKHDGEHYQEMMEQRNGEEIFGVWNGIIQLAAKCPRRGYLIKANGQAYDVKGIASRLRMKERAVKRGVEFLLARTDWMEARDMEEADVLRALGGSQAERNERRAETTATGNAPASGGRSGFGTPEPDRAAVIDRVMRLKRKSEWFIQTEGTFARTVQAIFGKEWEQIGGWRKRYREDAKRTQSVWEEFAAKCTAETESEVKRPGKYLNDLWTGGRVGVKG